MSGKKIKKSSFFLASSTNEQILSHFLPAVSHPHPGAMHDVTRHSFTP